MNDEANLLIRRLGLEPLPVEGGFFRSTWTSPVAMPDGRAAGSAILFLVTPGGFSALHRLASDEIWHFHAGDPAELILLDPATGTGRSVVLGPDPLSGHAPQAVAPAGVWQGARLAAGAVRGWSLFGCTMAPGWLASEFELGLRADLEKAFPGHAGIIRSLMR